MSRSCSVAAASPRRWIGSWRACATVRAARCCCAARPASARARCSSTWCGARRAVASRGRRGTIDYGAAKAALVNLSKSLAQEFGAKGIHVNCVSPGPVSTELWLGDHGVAATVATAGGVDADTARETVIAGIGGFATGRFTTPEEVATLVVLLASERTANVTGANYVIDGGLIKST